MGLRSANFRSAEPRLLLPALCLLGTCAVAQQPPAIFQPGRQAAPPKPGNSQTKLRDRALKQRTSSSNTTLGSCKLYAFEGVPDRTSIPSFDGISAPGWVGGITDEVAGGTAQFINAPSGDTVAVFLNGGTDQINFASPVQSIDFYYATAYATTLTGYDSNGNVVAGPVTLPPNWDGNPAGYEDWNQSPLLQAQGNVISSVDIRSAATLNNFLGIDEFHVCRELTIASVEMTQAIQQYQTLSQLESSLNSSGEPPVPIVANKPGAMRIYMDQPSDVQAVNVEVSIPSISFDETKNAILMPNCSPEQQRLPENGCSSTDFYFIPGSGAWSATITVTDPDSGTVLEQEVLPFKSRSTNSFIVKGHRVCGAFINNQWSGCNNNLLTFLAHTDMLSQLAPTGSFLPLIGFDAVDVDYSGYQEMNFPTAQDRDTAWWTEVDKRLFRWWLQYDKVSDRTQGRYTNWFGLIPAGTAPACCGGLALSIPSHAASALTDLSYYRGVDAVSWAVSHENGHTLGGEHTVVDLPFVPAPNGGSYGCFLQSGSDNPNWPFPDNRIQSTPTPPNTFNGEVGFNVSTKTALDPQKTFEQMGYCQPGWSSPTRYKTMITTLGGGTVSSPSVAPPTAPAPNLSDPQPRISATQAFWMVSGSIPATGAVVFDPLFEQTMTGDTSGGSGAYSLVVQNSVGAALFTQYLDLGQPTDAPAGVTGLPQVFAASVPVTAGAAQIVLEDPGNNILGQIHLGGASPTVAITNPTASFDGTTPISWTIVDPDSSTFDSQVLYSPDNGTTWGQIGEATNSGTSLMVDFTQLPGTNGKGLIKVLVSDGVNTGSATSPNFTIPRKAPSGLGIGTPAAGAYRQAADAVQFSGYAYDIDDGALMGSALAWSSNLQGALGTGSPLAVSLQLGVHTITLTATDSDGNQISASQTLTITDQAPAVNTTLTTLSAPPNSAAACQEATVTASVGQYGAPLSAVQYSVDGGNTYTQIPLNQLPYSFYVPGTGLISLVVEAIDQTGLAFAQSGSYFNLYPCASLTVPNIVGQTQNNASTALGNAGFVAAAVTNGASTIVPAGSVMSQNPAAGTPVSTGGSVNVNLVISSGPQVGVPNVVGQAQAAASGAIVNAGLTVGTIANSSSATVPFGEVISESPAPGATVGAGTAVSLIVSTGSALSISSPASLSSADAGSAYIPAAVTATGGSPPYTWSAAGLPAGMTIDPLEGMIGGTPTSNSGSPFSVTVTVTDSKSLTANRGYSLAVTPPLTISGPASLPTGTVGAAYGAPAFVASGGSGSYRWFATGQAPGLKMNAGNGVLSGVPATNSSSPYAVQVTVTDTNGAVASSNYALSIQPGRGNLCAVTGDGTPGIADIQYEINEALGANSPANDLNADGVVNVVDVQTLLESVLQGTCLAG